MDGDFKGDFTRDTFNIFKGFSRVLMQQGRVQLDADWNEQADILLWLVRRLAKDVIGSQGTPEANKGFQIDQVIHNDGVDFTISRGEYYVDGILIENEGTVDNQGQPTLWSYTNQPYWPAPSTVASQTGPFLVYLDIWERQISFIEDNSIREVALGVTGPDTATRAQVVWRVGVLTGADFQPLEVNLENFFSQLSVMESSKLTRFLLISDLKDDNPNKIDLNSLHSSQKDPLRLGNPGKLRARAKVNAPETDLSCIIPPDAQFRGAENQFYRVEIHNGGPAWPGSPSGGSTHKVKGASGEGSPTGATFKWSRENGSVVFPIVDISGQVVTLANLGRDERSTLEVGDWVEVVDDTTVFQVFGNTASQPHPLLQVQIVNTMTMEVTLSSTAGSTQPDKHPLLRRWDEKARPAKKGEPDLFDPNTGTMKIVEGNNEEKVDSSSESGWITLEDGVQIQFEHNPDNPAFYHPGDYWLIPARVITKDVEWPKQEDGTHKLLPPRGVKHHIAALALVNDGQVMKNAPVTFASLVQLTPQT